MDTQFEIPIKITWHVDNTFEWQSSFYPSLVKKIKKSEEEFSSEFSVTFEDLTKDFYLKKFYPLYVKQIASKKKYHLDLDAQREKILSRINDKDSVLKLGYAYQKETGNFVGGALFSVWPTKVSVVHRVFDRKINREYRHATTIDYWFEAKFREYTQTLKKPLLTHGTDTHPFVEGMGLALFKLRVGGLPWKSDKYHETIISTLSDLKEKRESILFFRKPTNTGQYSRAKLLYTKDSNMSLINGLKAVLGWAKIETEYIRL